MIREQSATASLLASAEYANDNHVPLSFWREEAGAIRVMLGYLPAVTAERVPGWHYRHGFAVEHDVSEPGGFTELLPFEVMAEVARNAVTRHGDEVGFSLRGLDERARQCNGEGCRGFVVVDLWTRNPDTPLPAIYGLVSAMSAEGGSDVLAQVTSVRVEPGSTVGLGWGYSEHGERVIFAGDWRPMADLALAVESAPGYVYVRLEDYQVLQRDPSPLARL